MIFKTRYIILVLLLIALSFLIQSQLTGEVITSLTQPDFNKYPNLILRGPDMETVDFLETKKATYYYNFVGTEIPFTLGEKEFLLEIRDVSYDLEEKEYAEIYIISSAMTPVYTNIYQGEEHVVELFDKKIILLAEKIIDHDNIEYFTIKDAGEVTPEVIEEPIIETEQQEPEEQPPETPQPTQEQPIVIPQQPGETIKITLPEILLMGLNGILLLTIILLVMQRRKI